MRIPLHGAILVIEEQATAVKLRALLHAQRRKLLAIASGKQILYILKLFPQLSLLANISKFFSTLL